MQVKGIKLYLKPMGFLAFTRISCLSWCMSGGEGRRRRGERERGGGGSQSQRKGGRKVGSARMRCLLSILLASVLRRAFREDEHGLAWVTLYSTHYVSIPREANFCLRGCENHEFRLLAQCGMGAPQLHVRNVHIRALSRVGVWYKNTKFGH